MVGRKRQALVIVGGVLILVMALGVSAVFAQIDSQSAGQVEIQTVSQPVLQDGDDAQDEPEDGDSDGADKGWPGAPFARRGGFGGREGFPGQGTRGHGIGGRIESRLALGEVVAESLGVTVEQMEEARSQVFEAFVEESDGEFRGRRGFAGSDELNSLLAQALSDISGQEITVEDLAAAHEAARQVMLEALPEGFGPSDEQLELMEALRAAHQALQEAIDHEAVMIETAEIAGLDPATLLEAQGNRQSMSALLEESGVTVEEFVAAHREARENAVQNAVPEFITQEQADLILESGQAARGFSGGQGNFQGQRGHGCHGNHGGGFGGRGGPGGFGPATGNAPTSGVSL